MGAEGYGGPESMGGGGSTPVSVTLASAYANGAGSLDSTIIVDASRAGLTVTASGLAATVVPATINHTLAPAAGAGVSFAINGTFAPASGTASYSPAVISYTVNQTGGANGAVTGLRVNATETAVVGTHKLFDLQVAGVSKLSVSNAGALTVSGAVRLDQLGATGLVRNTNGGNLSVATPGTDYVAAAGVAGGQTVKGGTLTTETLVLRANATDAITATLGKNNLIVAGAIGAQGGTFTSSLGGTYITNDLLGSAGIACYNPTSGLASLSITAAAVTITNTGVNYLTISTVAVTMVNSQNLIFGTGAGTKIGTATTQKLALWNATPVVQPNTTGTATGFTAGAGTAVKDDSTFTGGVGATAYRISDVVLALKQLGAMAA